jgi:hypothetical protein
MEEEEEESELRKWEGEKVYSREEEEERSSEGKTVIYSNQEVGTLKLRVVDQEEEEEGTNLTKEE